MDNIAKIKKLLDDATKKGKNIILESVKAIFDKYPDLEMLGFYSYIPGFNDGDACEYTLCGPLILDRKNVQELKDDILGFHDFNRYCNRKHIVDWKDSAGCDFWDIISGYNDINLLEKIYGSNVSVKFTRDGKCEIEDYDCGY